MTNNIRVNDIVASLLMLIVALSPLPLGSNRPVYWAISGGIVFLAMMIFLGALAFEKTRIRIPLRRFAPLGVLAGIYLVYIVLSPNSNMLATLRTLSYMAFFFLMVQVSANRIRSKRLATGTFLAATIYAAIGFVMLYSKVELPGDYGLSVYHNDAHGTFINRNSYATYLGFGILLGMGLLVNRMRAFGDGMLALADEKMIFGGVGIALMLVTLLSTNSRMGFAAFAVAALFFVLVLAIKQTHAGLWMTLGVILGALILAGLAFNLYGATLLERLGSVERDADVRFALYEQVWEMIRAKPWTGHGADSFAVAFPEYHRLPVSPDLVWDKAHNTYLTNWVETGFIIGSIPTLLGLTVFIGLMRAVYKRQSRIIFPLVAASAILQGAVHSTVDFSLEIQANMYMLLAIVAIGFAEAKQTKKPGAQDV